MRRLAATLLLVVAAGPGVRTQRPTQAAGRGVITGRVVDAFGDPVINARILIETRTGESTTRQVAAADTDDRGEYRVARLPAGNYLVLMLRLQAIMIGPRPPESTYYPGSTTSAADAEVIHLDEAEEREAIDFVVASARPLISPVIEMRMQQLAAAGQRPVAGSSIVRGRVTTPGGRAFPTARDRAVEWRSVADARCAGRCRGPVRISRPHRRPIHGAGLKVRLCAGNLRRGCRGRFRSCATIQVLQLRYVAGRRRLVAAPSMARSTDDLGRYRVYGIAPGQYVVSATAPQSVATAAIHDDWTFEMSGLNGPRRLQFTHLPPGWALDEILVRGVDVTDRPLSFGRREQSLSGVEVRLTDRLAALKGAIVDGDARAAVGATLIVFASDRSRWYPMSRYIANTAANDEGAFSVVGLPFGSYYAAALLKLPVAGDDWQDPAFLETLIPRATSLTVSESETRPVRLTVRE